MKTNIVLACMVALLLGSLLFKGLRSEGGLTKEQGDAILKELRATRQELNQIKQDVSASKGRVTKQKRPKTAKVSTSGNPILGDARAFVTLVEFTDYQCPYCQNFYSKAYQALKKQYVDKGKLRFVLRDFPLPNHQHAKSAAISAHCAGAQNKFWEMHDALFESGGNLSKADILGYAKSVGLESDSFKSCFTSGRFDKDIKRDIQDAKNAGIRGYPGFCIGLHHR